MRRRTSASRRRRRATGSRQGGELLARLEDLQDLLRVNEVMAKTRPEDWLPVALVKRSIAGEHPVRIWREHRGLSLAALAKRAAVPQGYLSEIENRKKPGSVAAFRALSKVLEIPIDNLVP